ncbi:MAG: energy-coupling factor transporter ATPase [Clostridiales bacterium]|nr:MAG: energy-coupling factor transporter ATPase [Clostridiales bacterium]
MPLELKNVSYIYQPNTPNESTALNNVSLTINDGEFIGIIGHTGSGKSTLVQLLCGLLAPTSGQVFIDGVDINAKDTPKAERKKHRLQVGMVFQYPEHQLFEETVIADIAFGPKNLGFAEKEARALAKSAMKTVGLSADLAKSSPFDLSGGQKRRVAIAGVLAMNPKYLILDEPTAGLDPQGREEILAEVQSLRQKLGITVILVSHSMDDVARFADRLLVLNDSQLYMQGTSQEIFARAEEMRALGLDIPVVTAILKRLAQEGWDIDTSIVDLDQARAEITRAWRQKGGHKSC